MPLLLFTNEIPLTSHKGIEKVKELWGKITEKIRAEKSSQHIFGKIKQWDMVTDLTETKKEKQTKVLLCDDTEKQDNYSS